jgi:gliding motility-associated transport system permease protein
MSLIIATKELKTLFVSPIAWTVLTIVQAIAAFVFLKSLDNFLQLQPQLVELNNPPGVTQFVVVPLFGAAAIMLLILACLLAMRAVAEERRNRTLVFLTSAPLSMAQIAIGKFLGLLFFLLLTLIPIVLMPFSLAGATSLDYGLIASVCLGIVLLSAACAAVSLYMSSLTTHPVLAAFGTFAALFAMSFISEAVRDALSARGWHLPAALVQVFSPIKNFEPFSKGVIDTYAIACSLLLPIVFVVFAVRRLEGMRLRG